ncbi:hypothetical protein CRE_12106 [Caenorhabditis remanei]|uniref:F-box associated domain-containing protein n=1 Tax=Caenorhabditis remanei TaxID=31234 RepID=E3MPY0_CAERE|nr:hypothetical protein CRE_12106 [Caenorhabditis remanei]
MSVCSEKVRKVVRSLNLKPNKIKYALHESGTQVFIGYQEYDQTLQYFAVLYYYSSIDSKDKSINLGGNKMRHRFHKRPPNFAMPYYLSIPVLEDNRVLKLAHRHMTDLFRYKPRVQLVICCIATMFKSHVIKDVTDISFCLKKAELDTRVLEQFLITRPVQQSIQISSKLTGPPFRKDSRIWDAKGLSINGNDDRAAEIMENFRGHHLIFIDVDWNLKDWEQVMRKWKRREAYHDLKAISARTPNGVEYWFRGNILVEFQLKEWDGLRRPRCHMEDPNIINIQSDVAQGIDCTNWLDMQQDGGGKWASVVVTEKLIGFVVWD